MKLRIKTIQSALFIGLFVLIIFTKTTSALRITFVKPELFGTDKPYSKNKTSAREIGWKFRKDLLARRALR